MEKNKGFTIVELIMVLAIAGTLAAIGIPNFIKWIPDYRLKQISQLLFSDMQNTRMLAVKTGQDHAILFDTQNNKYMVCSKKGTDNTWKSCSSKNIKKIVNFKDISSKLIFGYGTCPAANPSDGVSYQNNNLVFNSRGVSSAGYVYLTNSLGTCYKVGTQSSGIILLRRWNGKQWQ